jgi:secondary thiamine-phosphate synthase enzyme
LKSTTTSIEVIPPSRYAFLDLTEELARAVKDSGVTAGAVVVFCPHTTCTLLINEWEEGALEDFRERVTRLVPEDGYFAHDDLARRTQNLDDPHERRNGHSHVTTMLLSSSSHAIPLSDGEPMLGRWQRLILLELDEPKERQVVFHVFGD